MKRKDPASELIRGCLLEAEVKIQQSPSTQTKSNLKESLLPMKNMYIYKIDPKWWQGKQPSGNRSKGKVKI